MQNQTNNAGGNDTTTVAKEQMPGLYQSKDISKLKSSDFPGMEDEQGQNRVTNDADPKAGTRQKDEREDSYYKKDLPDDDAIEENDDEEEENNMKENTTDTEQDMEDVKENFQDGDISVEPVLDKDGNEIGGQG